MDRPEAQGEGAEVTCRRCVGKGHVYAFGGDLPRQCSACHGTGVVTVLPE